MTEIKKRAYPVILEVAGPQGMFARPDSGSESCSYPIPPATACKGIIESICRIKDVQIDIVAVATCTMPQWGNHSFTSSSPIRKKNTIKSGNSCIVHATVLEDVKFQILGIATSNIINGINNAHSFQNQFFRRLNRGQSFRTVSIGWKNLFASYVGLPITPVETQFNTVLPSLVEDFDYMTGKASTFQNFKIKNGIAQYKPYPVTLKNGILAFENAIMQEFLEASLKGKA